MSRRTVARHALTDHGERRVKLLPGVGAVKHFSFSSDLPSLAAARMRAICCVGKNSIRSKDRCLRPRRFDRNKDSVGRALGRSLHNHWLSAVVSGLDAKTIGLAIGVFQLVERMSLNNCLPLSELISET